MEENQKKCYEIAERIYDLDVKMYMKVWDLHLDEPLRMTDRPVWRI